MIKYWEMIANKAQRSRLHLGYCSAVTRNGWRWIVDSWRQTRRPNQAHMEAPT